jgi:dynein heavy chain
MKKIFETIALFKF